MRSLGRLRFGLGLTLSLSRRSRYAPENPLPSSRHVVLAQTIRFMTATGVPRRELWCRASP